MEEAHTCNVADMCCQRQVLVDNDSKVTDSARRLDTGYMPRISARTVMVGLYVTSSLSCQVLGCLQLLFLHLLISFYCTVIITVILL